MSSTNSHELSDSARTRPQLALGCGFHSSGPRFFFLVRVMSVPSLDDYGSVIFDLDHTLIRYNLLPLFELIFGSLRQYLVEIRSYGKSQACQPQNSWIVCTEAIQRSCYGFPSIHREWRRGLSSISRQETGSNLQRMEGSSSHAIAVFSHSGRQPRDDQMEKGELTIFHQRCIRE